MPATSPLCTTGNSVAHRKPYCAANSAGPHILDPYSR